MSTPRLTYGKKKKSSIFDSFQKILSGIFLNGRRDAHTHTPTSTKQYANQLLQSSGHKKGLTYI